jgi:hypothetical protein
VFLTELMRAFMLVEKMPHIDTHPKIIEPWITDRENLLFGITIGVVDEVFWFLSPWDRKGMLDEYLKEINIVENENT